MTRHSFNATAAILVPRAIVQFSDGRRLCFVHSAAGVQNVTQVPLATQQWVWLGAHARAEERRSLTRALSLTGDFKGSELQMASDFGIRTEKVGFCDLFSIVFICRFF
jgi:hypothetical protein